MEFVMGAKAQETKILNWGMNVIKEELKLPRFCSTLNFSLKSENPEPWGVWYRFHHGMTFFSYGEKITISLTPINESSTKVDILSECGMPTQIIDYGKNAKNVTAIFRHLEKFLPSGLGQQSASTPQSVPYAPYQPPAPAPVQSPAPIPAPIPMQAPDPGANIPLTSPGESSLLSPAPSLNDSSFSKQVAPGQSSNCSACGARLVDNARFCFSCGAKVAVPDEIICPECGSSVKSTQTFCSSCGKRINK